MKRLLLMLHHRRSPSNFEVSQNKHSFQHSYSWVDRTARIFKRNAMKDVFLIIFQNFHNSNFSNVLSKMWEDIFQKRFVNQMTLVQIFSGKLPAISKYSKETFLLESAFAYVRNSELQGCSVREKGTLSQRFFENVRDLRTLFPY